MIVLRLTGNRDGSAAVDYTVNAASGFPLVTGAGGGMPVNHVLPAWDIAAETISRPAYWRRSGIAPAPARGRRWWRHCRT